MSLHEPVIVDSLLPCRRGLRPGLEVYEVSTNFGSPRTCLQDIAVRLQDPSEFVGIFVVVPMDPHRPYVAQTFVRMGFQFVPHEAALPAGVPRAVPERQEVPHVALPLPFPPCYSYAHTFVRSLPLMHTTTLAVTAGH